MNEVTVNFIEDLKNKCKKHGMTLSLVSKSKVKCGEFYLSGYFDPETMELAVATKRKISEWLPVIVHESCHLDQMIAGCDAWTKCGDAGEVIDDWLNGKDFTESRVKRAFKLTVDMELDCEKRTVDKIKEFGLPISTDSYIQSANLYMHFHNWCKINRKWVPKHKKLIQKPLTDIMPTKFQRSYKTTSQDILDAITNHLS